MIALGPAVWAHRYAEIFGRLPLVSGFTFDQLVAGIIMLIVFPIAMYLK